ncbi:TPA: hypothetical protein ACH3X2_004891 [Trebouxia sp. C0005]
MLLHDSMSRSTSCIRGGQTQKLPGQAYRAHAGRSGPCSSGHLRLRDRPFGQKVPATYRRRTQVAVLFNVPFPDISPDVLIPPFQFSNVAISVLWAPIILAPRWKVTEAIAKSRWSIIVPSIAFLYFFLAATVIDSPDLADVFQKSIFLFTDGAADPKNMAKLLSSPAYAAQDWVHVLIWDYGAGRLIYLDALKKGVPIRPALLVTFIAGPIGLLVHELTCAIAQPEKNAQQT